MTGAVDWETLIWVAGIVLGALALWWRIVSWAMIQFKQRDDAIAKLKDDVSIAVSAESARAKVIEDDLRRQIADHKLYAAENFATEKRFAEAVNRFQDSIDKLADRIDSMIAAWTSGERPTPARRASPTRKD